MNLIKEYLARHAWVVRLANKLKIKGHYGRVIRIEDKHVIYFINFLNEFYPSLHVNLLDCGALWGLKLCGIYSALAHLKNKTVHGIECNEEEAAKLRASGEYDQVYCEAVAGYTGEATLYVHEYKQLTSLKEYNPSFSDLFIANAPDQVNPIKVKVKALNEVLDKNVHYDFLKLNIEAIELDLLKSLNDTFYDSVYAIYTESQPMEIYKDAHMFDELLVWAREHHFMLLNVYNISFGPQIDNHILLVKDPRSIQTIDDLLKFYFIGILSKDPDFCMYMLCMWYKKFGMHKCLDVLARQLGCSSFKDYWDFFFFFSRGEYAGTCQP